MSRRILPCLDLKDGKVVKGVQFSGLKEMGEPIDLARRYEAQGADALVVLDIVGRADERPRYLRILQEICGALSMPVYAGGGIRSLEDMERVFAAGAAKACLASAAIDQPDLLRQASERYGSDKIVLAIDAARKPLSSGYELVLAGGKKRLDRDPVAWAQEGEALGAGEILLTSLDADGGQAGFDLVLTDAVARAVDIPLIASGGAGSVEDFIQLFEASAADAGLAASLFHQEKLQIADIRQALEEDA